jgi:DNA-binding transcriptional ArsR family regulator
MIEIVLAHTDLARVRFAHSPVAELVASLRVLHDPGRQHMYGGWLSAVQEQLDLSPAAVSQHLRILKETALVTARRRGRMVLYQRTAAATALLAAIRSDQATG